MALLEEATQLGRDPRWEGAPGLGGPTGRAPLALASSPIAGPGAQDEGKVGDAAGRSTRTGRDSDAERRAPGHVRTSAPPSLRTGERILDPLGSGGSELATRAGTSPVEGAERTRVRGDAGVGTSDPKAVTGGTSGLRQAIGAGQGGRRSGRQPRLSASSLSCSDLYPWSARVDRGVVTVELSVGARGRAELLRTVSVSPRDEAFVLAARACAERLRFAPARDEAGRAVEARAVVRLHFERDGRG